MDNVSLLCEQGDMGLWNTPVSKDDQQRLNESAEEKETEADK